MTRLPPFSSPLMIGFEAVERQIERLAKNGEGYPPYNIERIIGDDGALLRITLAVAGFTDDDLEITTEDNQLMIRGRQKDDSEGRDFLHRGIAARQFQRSFLLADGMKVEGAELENGLLIIELIQPKLEQLIKKVPITTRKSKKA